MRSLSQRIVDSSFKDPSPYTQPPHPALAELESNERFHRQVVLPGARRAVTQDELSGLQQQGLSEHEIVSRVNERWAASNAARVSAFEGWRDTEYAERVERARERQTERLKRMQAAGLSPVVLR